MCWVINYSNLIGFKWVINLTLLHVRTRDNAEQTILLKF
jgi:hypothetical protein